jgi:hypothetical protein
MLNPNAPANAGTQPSTDCLVRQETTPWREEIAVSAQLRRPSITDKEKPAYAGSFVAYPLRAAEWIRAFGV